MYVCVPCVCNAPGGQKRAFSPLELGPLGRVASALATESSLQSLVFLLTRSHGGQAALQLLVAKDDLELLPLPPLLR